ncbi:hypothetical protein H0H81_003429 [Sphagnurus paluster]|uniref:Uncharacterized protein n=1 Tax=Sphagnurus paluster TaxID=117069 RepID=A0A9P7FSW6_9AGAR|nr:hypothetical protein H0H81_003429 [Sphagnurus paluster]
MQFVLSTTLVALSVLPFTLSAPGTIGSLLEARQAADNIVYVTDANTFCMIMPRTAHTNIGDSEHPGGMQTYCSPAGKYASQQGQLPANFWRNVAFTSGKGKNGGRYAQLTGCIRPETLDRLNTNDSGGQYDSSGGVGGQGNPQGSKCLGYNHYVELVEPAGPRACIKCCDDPADCPTNKDNHPRFHRSLGAIFNHDGETAFRETTSSLGKNAPETAQETHSIAATLPAPKSRKSALGQVSALHGAYVYPTPTLSTGPAKIGYGAQLAIIEAKKAIAGRKMAARMGRRVNTLVLFAQLRWLKAAMQILEIPGLLGVEEEDALVVAPKDMEVVEEEGASAWDRAISFGSQTHAAKMTGKKQRSDKQEAATQKMRAATRDRTLHTPSEPTSAKTKLQEPTFKRRCKEMLAQRRALHVQLAVAMLQAHYALRQSRLIMRVGLDGASEVGEDEGEDVRLGGGHTGDACHDEAVEDKGAFNEDSDPNVGA